MNTPQKKLRFKLNEWFLSPLGLEILQFESRWLEHIVDNLFGYHIAQIGKVNNTDLLSHSRISHKTVISLEEDGELPVCNGVVSSSEALSIASNSLDVVLLPHVLEYVGNPHKLLREIERVLIGEGHLIIVGFNPWSFWGIWRILWAWSENPPWFGHFYGLPRIRDWLSLLDFDLIRIEKLFFRPPIKNMRIMQRISFMEKLGNYCWPFFGGVYIVVAKKRVIPLTPVKLQWSKRRKMVASGITEPSTRTNQVS